MFRTEYDESYWNAYRAAMAADDAYSAELVRVYGRSSGDARYWYKGHTDPKLIAAMDAKLAADEAFRTSKAPNYAGQS